LVEQAKKRTGIQADTDLIAFALANARSKTTSPKPSGNRAVKVDPSLKLGF